MTSWLGTFVATVYTIRYRRIVDLTHALAPGMPVWPGDPQPVIDNRAGLESRGYFLNAFSLGEHSGTHVGAPAHFQADQPTVDRLPVETFVRPAVVLDVAARAEQDADYQLTRDDVLAWERAHGLVPAASLAILHSGWQRRWPDARAFLNADAGGRLHFPGFSLAAAEFLIADRGVAGLGIDTHGVDPGADPQFLVNRLLCRHGLIHLENLANLDLLPAVGTVLVIGGLKLAGGSGSPARVFAFLP